MKLKILLCLSLLPLLVVAGQTQDLMQELVKTSCQHVRATNYEQYSLETAQEQMTVFFRDLFLQHAQQIRDTFQLDIYDDEDASNFGELFGSTLAKQCPIFLQFLLKVEQADAESFNREEEGSIEGTLLRFEGKELLFFVLQDDDEQEHKLLWLNYFWGSENFYHNRGNMLGKRFRIHYKERSYFLPKSGRYEWIKEITDLDFR